MEDIKYNKEFSKFRFKIFTSFKKRKEYSTDDIHDIVSKFLIECNGIDDITKTKSTQIFKALFVTKEEKRRINDEVVRVYIIEL